MGAGAGELLEAVDMFAAVSPMSSESLERPFGQSIVPIVIRRRVHEIQCELTADDQFLEKRGTVFVCCFGISGCQRHLDWRDLPEMQIGRERRDFSFARMNTGSDIPLQLPCDELIEAPLCLFVPTPDIADR